jgi:hypothetical protein
MDGWIRGKKPIQLRMVGRSAGTRNRPVAERLPEPGAPAPGGWDGLSLGEQALVSSYRRLDSVPRLATRCFVTTGDLRLVRVIYDHFFLGPGRR